MILVKPDGEWIDDETGQRIVCPLCGRRFLIGYIEDNDDEMRARCLDCLHYWKLPVRTATTEAQQ